MKGLATVVAAPAALVLLIGAGMSVAGDRPPAPVSQPVSTNGVPGPAPPFPGDSTGCSVPDPTGTGGCVTAATAWLLASVEERFGQLPTSCWDEHAWNPTSDHPQGRACDHTFGRIGEFPDAADRDRGWGLAEWFRANADALSVSYVIWQGRIWSSGRADAGWRTYSGGGVYDASDPTGGHYDHVHVSVTR